MASNDPLPGLCGARVRTSDGYCQKHPINGTGRCRLHGGAGGAPEGNQNAVGNAGGGAPALNRNSWKHGAFADVEKLDARLEGDAREHVDTLAASLLDRAAETVPEMPVDRRWELAREAAVLLHQTMLANADLIASENGGRGFAWERERTIETSDGETVTYTEAVANPVWRQSIRLTERHDRIYDELNLWPAP
jgi:hypothetical protein